jgi:hypothetical protein
MTVRESLLLALRAPGSIEAEVCRIGEGIFRARGYVSAIALEPLVPVAFLDAEPGGALPRGFLESLDVAVRAPWRIAACSPGSARWKGGALYLCLDTGGAWQALRRASARAPARTPGLFPVAEGFFLGCLEAANAERRSVAREARQLIAGPGGRPASAVAFTSATLAVIRITTPARGTRWWREVSCEVVAEKPLRGRKA